MGSHSKKENFRISNPKGGSFSLEKEQEKQGFYYTNSTPISLEQESCIRRRKNQFFLSHISRYKLAIRERRTQHFNEGKGERKKFLPKRKLWMKWPWILGA